MGYRYEIVGLPNPAEVSARARGLVSEIARGLATPAEANVPATLAASSVQWVLFTVYAVHGLSEDEARAACELALKTLRDGHVFNDQRPAGQA